MNKYTYQNILAVVQSGFRKHVHDVAAVSCGALMGIVFLTFHGYNDARSPAALLTIPVSSESSSDASMTVSSSSSSELSSESSSLSFNPVAPLPPAPKKSIPKAIKTVTDSSVALRPAAPEEIPAPVSSESSSSSSTSSEVSSSETFSSASWSSSSIETVSSSSSVASSSSSEAPAPVLEESDFPAFDHASWPVGKSPNWGAMTTPAEWTRNYSQMTDADFVKIPSYTLSVLTTPMSSLTNPRNDAAITAKLFYSTRYFGTYDLDSDEFTGSHAGVDLKLARGTPIGAIGGGRVVSASFSQMLGTHVIIEHRLKNGETYYSIYGHLDRASVRAGQDVKPGTTVGVVGMTGNTTAPHLHLQIDRGQPGENHEPYFTTATPGAAEAARHVVNPVKFLGMYRSGD